MPRTETPANLTDYLRSWMLALHSNARLVFVFDPSARLGLGETLAAGGRDWQVFQYGGNDLSLRASLARVTAREALRLVWVTGRDGSPAASSPINLSSLSDLLAMADDWVDLSMVGVLQALIPNEVWPVAVVEEYADLLSANLPALVMGHDKLRMLIGQHTALDASSVRGLALHVSQPTVPVDDLLFQRDDVGQLLRRYIRLAWLVGWDARGRELLRRHVRDSSVAALGDVQPWIDTPIDDLARYLYVRRFLSRNHVPQIANQLRGLGILGFDPEPLETRVDQVLVRWEREQRWRDQVVEMAEASLSPEDLARIVGLVAPEGPDEWSRLHTIEGAGLFTQYASAVLKRKGAQGVGATLLAWRSVSLAAPEFWPATRHSIAANALIGFLDEASVINSKLGQDAHAGVGLASLIDWYVAGGFFDLEFAHARAIEHVRVLLPDDPVLAALLSEHLTKLNTQLRGFLRQADLELAKQIRESWQQYLSSPRLATYVLSDFVKRRRMQPTREECLWFVVFDGMRWDTWQRVVKPRLCEHFEFVEPEKAYLSLLPSWTMVARTALLTGQLPKYWQRRPGQTTVDQRLLAAHAFGISTADMDRKLRFHSNVEADRQYLQLDADDRFPWNVLIFNISDDNLHKEEGNLAALNRTISGYLDSIMQTLCQMVRPGDALLVSSDHGFIQLDASDGVVIRDEARWQRQSAGSADPVRYRYLLGIKSNHGLAFDLPGFQPSEFTAAVSQTWFKRSDDRRRPDRYAHGGLSLGEMVVPGALLRRIVEKKVELVLDDAPTQLAVREGEAISFTVALHNRGNQIGTARLEVRLGAAAHSVVETLQPAERKIVALRLPPRLGRHGKTPAHIDLIFTTQDAQREWQTPRRREIQLQVEERKDIVEIQFAGLDALDDL